MFPILANKRVRVAPVGKSLRITRLHELEGTPISLISLRFYHVEDFTGQHSLERNLSPVFLRPGRERRNGGISSFWKGCLRRLKLEVDLNLRCHG